MKDRPALGLSIIMKVSKTCWLFLIQWKIPLNQEGSLQRKEIRFDCSIGKPSLFFETVFFKHLNKKWEAYFSGGRQGVRCGQHQIIDHLSHPLLCRLIDRSDSHKGRIWCPQCHWLDFAAVLNGHALLGHPVAGPHLDGETDAGQEPSLRWPLALSNSEASQLFLEHPSRIDGTSPPLPCKNQLLPALSPLRLHPFQTHSGRKPIAARGHYPQ